MTETKPQRKVTRRSTLSYALGYSNDIYAKPKGFSKKTIKSVPVASDPAITTPAPDPPTAPEPIPAPEPGPAVAVTETPAVTDTTPAAAVTDSLTETDPNIFTTEQDAELLNLKGENKSWKDIGAALEKPPWVVKNRFKEINPNNSNNSQNSGGGNNKKDKGGKGKKGQRDDNATTTPAEAGVPGAWVTTTPEENAWGWGEGNGTTAGTTNADWQTANEGVAVTGDGRAEVIELHEDENFTMDDLVLLARIIKLDEKDMWLRVASAFYDKTGKRYAEGMLMTKMTGGLYQASNNVHQAEAAGEGVKDVSQWLEGVDV